MASGVRGWFASLGRYARWWFDNTVIQGVLIFLTCGILAGLVLLERLIFWDGWEAVVGTAAFVAFGWLFFAWDAIYWRVYLSRRPSTGRHAGRPWEK